MRRRTSHSRRRAFSLLEVILALGILVGALAVLGQLVQTGLRNAQMARDLSQAQLLCESRLAEIHSGAASSQPASKSPIQNFPGWLVTIEQQASSSSQSAVGGQGAPVAQGFSGTVNLLKLHVTVEQDPAEQRNPVKFSLTQWMIDPSVTAVQLQPVVDPATANGSQSGSSQTGGSSSTQGR
jgi:general secretion pathway protein I